MLLANIIYLKYSSTIMQKIKLTLRISIWSEIGRALKSGISLSPRMAFRSACSTYAKDSYALLWTRGRVTASSAFRGCSVSCNAASSEWYIVADSAADRRATDTAIDRVYSIYGYKNAECKYFVTRQHFCGWKPWKMKKQHLKNLYTVRRNASVNCTKAWEDWIWINVNSTPSI